MITTLRNCNGGPWKLLPRRQWIPRMFGKLLFLLIVIAIGCSGSQDQARKGRAAQSLVYIADIPGNPKCVVTIKGLLRKYKIAAYAEGSVSYTLSVPEGQRLQAIALLKTFPVGGCKVEFVGDR